MIRAGGEASASGGGRGRIGNANLHVPKHHVLGEDAEIRFRLVHRVVVVEQGVDSLAPVELKLGPALLLRGRLGCAARHLLDGVSGHERAVHLGCRSGGARVVGAGRGRRRPRDGREVHEGIPTGRDERDEEPRHPEGHPQALVMHLVLNEIKFAFCPVAGRAKLSFRGGRRHTRSERAGSRVDSQPLTDGDGTASLPEQGLDGAPKYSSCRTSYKKSFSLPARGTRVNPSPRVGRGIGLFRTSEAWGSGGVCFCLFSCPLSLTGIDSSRGSACGRLHIWVARGG